MAPPCVPIQSPGTVPRVNARGTVPGAGRTRAYTDGMALDIAAVQAALTEDGLDGWLLYDFHGSNPIARSLAGLNGSGSLNVGGQPGPPPANQSFGPPAT